MKQKVLITGASGFLGFHIVNAALEENLEVFAAVRKSSKIDHLQHLPINFLCLDFADSTALYQICSENNFDFIIHAAGTTKAGSSSEFYLVNDQYTQNLAVAAKKTGLKRFVFISSLAATGPIRFEAGKIEEQLVPNPLTAYGKSKLSAEINLKKLDLPLTILRPTAIYGPREKDIFIINQYLKRGFEPYIGNQPQRLSFVYAKDVAKLAVKSLKLLNADGVFNITDGQEYNRYHYASIVKKLLVKKTFKMHLPVLLVKCLLFMADKAGKVTGKVPAVNNEKLGELTAENWVCDIANAQKYLQFSPEFDLEKGLKETISWYQQNNWL